MGNNLTGQLISATYEQLVQISGSILTDGTGSNITSLDITASNAVSALSANSASVATSASYALTASYAANVPDTASFAISASHAANADNSISSSYALTASFLEGGIPTPTLQQVTTAGAATSASITLTDGVVASNVINGNGSDFTLSSIDASTNLAINFFDASSINGGFITFDVATGGLNIAADGGATLTGNADTATSASHAVNADSAISSSYAVTASFALNAGGGELSGLISGSGTDSLISANYQSTASFALGVESIAIGNNTQADSANQVILGTDITSSGGSNDRSITIGTDNILQGSANDNVLIGDNLNAQAGKNKAVYIGNNPSTNFVNSDSVCIGYDTQAAILNVSIGNLSRATGNNAVSVGYNAISNAEAAISIGRDAFSSGQYDVTLGYDARTETGNNAITIGKSARNISANDSIVIGNGQSVGVANEINIGGIFRYNSGSNGIIELQDDTQVTGSVSISTVMNLAPQDPLPAGVLGDIAVSGSSGAANVYFYDGTAWTAMI